MHKNAIAAVCCSLIGLASSACLAAPPVNEPMVAARDSASATEVEFWRSTEKIGTADAYRAYLQAYSSGVFAPLAHAALTKLQRPSSAAPMALARPAAPEGGAGEGLKEFSGPAQSDAVSYKLGDRFAGPTTIAIGSVGARKQLVLPTGEWVALSAFDGENGRLDPVSVTTLTFGKFAGQRLSAMLQMTVNRRALPDRPIDWTGIEECQQADAARLHEWKVPASAWMRECVAVRFSAAILTSSGETNVSLSRLGARVQGGGIVTDMHFADAVNGYLHVRRIDWPAATSGEQGSDPNDWTPGAVAAVASRSAYVKGLVAWADAYRGVAAEGFRGRISRVEPVRGIPVSMPSAVPALGEIGASKVAQSAPRQ